MGVFLKPGLEIRLPEKKASVQLHVRKLSRLAPPVDRHPTTVRTLHQHLHIEKPLDSRILTFHLIPPVMSEGISV